MKALSIRFLERVLSVLVAFILVGGLLSLFFAREASAAVTAAAAVGVNWWLVALVVVWLAGAVLFYLYFRRGFLPRPFDDGWSWLMDATWPALIWPVVLAYLLYLVLTRSRT